MEFILLSIEQIVALKKQGVTTLSQLAMIKYCQSPRPFNDVAQEINITIRGIERMLEKESPLVKVVPINITTNTVGRPASRALQATAKAKRLIKKIESMHHSS